MVFQRRARYLRLRPLGRVVEGDRQNHLINLDWVKRPRRAILSKTRHYHGYCVRFLLERAHRWLGLLHAVQDVVRFDLFPLLSVPALGHHL